MRLRRLRRRRHAGATAKPRHARAGQAQGRRRVLHAVHRGKGGKLVGLDGEILSGVAKKLGLEGRAAVTDFNGMLGGVQSHRVDITIGGVAWTKERSSRACSPTRPTTRRRRWACTSGKTYSTVDDLEGQRLGTVTGYVWVKSIKAIPGAKLGAYPNAQRRLRRPRLGRLDVGFLDPLLIINEQKARPDHKIETEYLTPPTPQQVKQHPEYEYFRPYMTASTSPSRSRSSRRRSPHEIDKMYAERRDGKLIQKWGGDPDKFLTPSPWMADMRRGVDRPDDWTPPSRRELIAHVPGPLVGLHLRPAAGADQDARVHRRPGSSAPRCSGSVLALMRLSPAAAAARCRRRSTPSCSRTSRCWRSSS